MSPKTVLFGVLVAGCAASAGAGAWLASRPATGGSAPAAASSTASPASATATSPAGDDAALAASPVKAGAAVAETETVVGPEASKPGATPNATPVRPVEIERPAPRPVPAPSATASRGRDRRTPSEPRQKPREKIDVREATPAPVEVPAVPAPASTPSEPQPVVEPTRPVEAPTSGSPVDLEPPVLREKVLEELVVAANSVLGLQLETSLTSETAKIEDRVDARVTRDVRVGGEVAIPAGTRALGSVITADRGGKFKERARLGIRFHTLVLGDGTRLPLKTETVFREGNDPTRGSSAKVGGAAVGGAILGAILGGRKGAAIGGAVGAAGGTAAVVSGDRSVVAMPAGTSLTVRLSDPVSVTIEK